jgi:hypothetical protein
MIAEWEGLSRVSRIASQNPKFGRKEKGKEKAPGIIPGPLPTLPVVGYGGAKGEEGCNNYNP